MKKPYYLIIVIFCISALLTACGGAAQPASSEQPAQPAQPAEEAATPSFAVFAESSEPITSWDPAIEFSNGIHVHNNMYEQLLRYDPETKEVKPLLAESYSVSDDGLTWTFKLRQGVKFQNGDDMTAEDVKYSIDRTMELGAGASYIWYGVEEVNVVDPHTVEFKLGFQTPLDLVATTGYAAFIYSSKCVDENNTWIDETPGCGTGPYMLKSAKWGDEVIMEAFPDYWGGWRDNSINTAIIKKVAEPATRRQMVETGDAAIAMEFPITDINAMKNNPNVNVIEATSFVNLIAMFNTQKPPLDNVLVRQALSYAFPYDQVIESVLEGYGRQSYGMVPYGMWGYSDQLPRYNNDLDKARELLAEAGYPDGGFKLLLTYGAGNEAEKSASELYKGELAKLNIDMEIRGMPWDSKWEMGKSSDPDARQDIFMMYWWPDLPSPYSFLYSTFHSEEEVLFNLGYYSNPDFDTMIDEANELTVSDFEKAESMFVDAQEILLNDAASLFIYDREDLWVTASNLKGFKYNPAYPNVVFFHELSFE